VSSVTAVSTGTHCRLGCAHLACVQQIKRFTFKRLSPISPVQFSLFDSGANYTRRDSQNVSLAKPLFSYRSSCKPFKCRAARFFGAHKSLNILNFNGIFGQGSHSDQTRGGLYYFTTLVLFSCGIRRTLSLFLYREPKNSFFILIIPQNSKGKSAQRHSTGAPGYFARRVFEAAALLQVTSGVIDTSLCGYRKHGGKQIMRASQSSSGATP